MKYSLPPALTYLLTETQTAAHGRRDVAEIISTPIKIIRTVNKKKIQFMESLDLRELWRSYCQFFSPKIQATGFKK